MIGKKQHWIGFDLGGTKMLAAVLDADFKTLGSKRKKTKAWKGAEAGVGRIIKGVYSAMEDAGVSIEDIAGMGIGSPGPLDLDTGVLIDLANLGWKNVPLKELLEKEFGFPVTVVNDVDAGVYGEYVQGAAQGARCVVGVFPGTGIGGGCVYEGEILRGKTTSSFEVGHICVEPDGPECGCGLRGCLEAVASRRAIATEAAEAARNGQAPYLLENTGAEIADIRSGALASSIENGDKAIEEIVRKAARRLGAGLATVVTVMSPDIVVLGGGLIEAMPDLYMEEAGPALENGMIPALRGTTKLVTAQLGDDATVVGAAAWVQHSGLRPSEK